jgi:NAD(P)-dependent dehydrogenase (short-subunit alcohol dehydrogenase family)
MLPVLITGVSPTSIGADTAYAFAAHQPKMIILASRTQNNIDCVANQIRSRHPSVPVDSLLLDLSSQKSVRAAASHLNSQISQLDILINNAVIMAVPTRTLSEDGIELQFATNHLGHFLFTNLVLNKLCMAAKASGASPGATRVVMVSSNGHRFSPVRFHDWNFEQKPIPVEEEPGVQAMIDRGMDPPQFDENGYDRFVAYGQSKTANILFALALRKRLATQGIQAVSVHPGSKSAQWFPKMLRFQV